MMRFLAKLCLIPICLITLLTVDKIRHSDAVGIFMSLIHKGNHNIEIFFLSDEELFDSLKMDDDYVQKLYQMLKDTTNILEIAGIEYSLDGGALLGALRNQSLIPWDDDVDIMVLKKQKFLSTTPIFEKLGYRVCSDDGFYKIKPTKGEAPFIDLYVVKVMYGCKTLEYEEGSLNKLWGRRWLPNVNDFFPLKKYKIGPLNIYGPQNARNFIKDCYKNWNKEIKISRNHHNMKHNTRIFRPYRGVFTAKSLPKDQLTDNRELIASELKLLKNHRPN